MDAKNIQYIFIFGVCKHAPSQLLSSNAPVLMIGYVIIMAIRAFLMFEN